MKEQRRHSAALSSSEASSCVLPWMEQTESRSRRSAIIARPAHVLSHSGEASVACTPPWCHTRTTTPPKLPADRRRPTARTKHGTNLDGGIAGGSKFSAGRRWACILAVAPSARAILCLPSSIVVVVSGYLILVGFAARPRAGGADPFWAGKHAYCDRYM